MRFDAFDDQIDVGDPSALDLERTDSWTITAWINPTDFSGYSPIYSKYDEVAAKGYLILIEASTGNIYIAIGGTVSSNWIQVTSTTAVSSGVWSHVAWSYDGSSTAAGNKIYINGALVGDTDNADTLSQTIVHNATGLIGSRQGSVQVMYGDIDDLRIYNRVLSGAEIATIYASHGRDPNVYGLIGRWLMNEDAPGDTPSGSGQCKDISANKNNGTPNNFLTQGFTATVLTHRRRIA